MITSGSFRPVNSRSCDICSAMSISGFSICCNDKQQHASIYFVNMSPTKKTINPLERRGNYSVTSNNVKSVHWPLMGGLLHLVQRGGDWAGPQPAPPRPLLAVPNETAHLSTANVPIIVLLYNDPLLDCCVKGITDEKHLLYGCVYK